LRTNDAPAPIAIALNSDGVRFMNFCASTKQAPRLGCSMNIRCASPSGMMSTIISAMAAVAS